MSSVSSDLVSNTSSVMKEYKQYTSVNFYTRVIVITNVLDRQRLIFLLSFWIIPRDVARNLLNPPHYGVIGSHSLGGNTEDL